MDCICETIFQNINNILSALQRQATQVCDNERCFDDEPSTQQSQLVSNRLLIIGGLILLSVLMGIFNRRPTLTDAKPRATFERNSHDNDGAF